MVVQRLRPQAPNAGSAGIKNPHAIWHSQKNKTFIISQLLRVRSLAMAKTWVLYSECPKTEIRDSLGCVSFWNSRSSVRIMQLLAEFCSLQL